MAWRQMVAFVSERSDGSRKLMTDSEARLPVAAYRTDC